MKTKIKIRAAARVLICLAVFSGARADDLFSPGFREMRSGGAVFGIWYPTAAAAQKTRLGPFDAEHAPDAPPLGEKLPLVVLSHGSGGYYRNHHLTAAHLAKNGFVVVAPQHKDARDAPPDMHSRIDDLKGAVAALQKHEEFAPIADANNVSAIGYSLGGATALAAAGVGINWEAFKLHCARNHDKDENACGGFPFYFRWLLRAKHAFLPNPKTAFYDFSENPAVYRKIALVAPVGRPMDEKTLASLPAEVLILQIDGDEILRAPFHSEHLRDNLPPQRTRLELIRGAHHYGFVAPFPRRITEKEYIPGAADPPGFDRAAFIARINEKILAFLRE